MYTSWSRCLLFGLKMLGLPACAGLLVGQGCPAPSPAPGGSQQSFYNNTTDRTNDGATYLGSSACYSCHSDMGEKHRVHGHSHKLTRIQGGPPVFPAEASRAGMPALPEGYAWSDIAYVIGGYHRKGRFIDQDGYIVTGGYNGVDSQWNLAFPPNGTEPSFVAYEPNLTKRKPYDYSCFICHTTGPMPQDPANPLFQDNRPGMAGTFVEEGVGCEACHGPGSKHIPNPAARNLYVDTDSTTCATCHSRPFNLTEGPILAAGGFIRHQEQYQELKASGGHSALNCSDCHDPHVSTNYDRDNAIRKSCTDCHPDKTMGFHAGVEHAKGDYVETMTCISCHMPFASKSATGVTVGESKGRIGDLRTHLFRINTTPVDYKAMFTADLLQVVKDEEGRAAVTVDFACLRCHNSDNTRPFRLTIKSASEIASRIHK